MGWGEGTWYLSNTKKEHANDALDFIIRVPLGHFHQW